jgi:hypothetical protein
VQLARESGNRRFLSYALGNRASHLLIAGATDEAAAHYDEAVALATATGDRIAIGLWVGERAACDLERGRLVEAERGFEETFAIHREISAPRTEGSLLIAFADLMRRTGRVAASEAALRRAIAIGTSLSDRDILARAQAALAELTCDAKRDAEHDDEREDLPREAADER